MAPLAVDAPPTAGTARPGRPIGGGGWWVAPSFDATRLELVGEVPGLCSFLALDGKVLLAGIYLRPTTSPDTPARNRECLTLPAGDWESIVAVGDFNADFESGLPRAHEEQRYWAVIETLCNGHGLRHVPAAADASPSYTEGTSPRSLDHIFTNLPDTSAAFCSSLFDIASDHLLVYANIAMPWTRGARSPPPPRVVLNLAKLHAEQFAAHLDSQARTPTPQDLCITGLTRQASLDEAMVRLERCLMAAAEHCAGVKTVGLRRLPPRIEDPEVREHLRRGREILETRVIPALKAGDTEALAAARTAKSDERRAMFAAVRRARANRWEMVMFRREAAQRGTFIVLAETRRAGRTRCPMRPSQDTADSFGTPFGALVARRPWQPDVPDDSAEQESPQDEAAALALAALVCTPARLATCAATLAMAKAPGPSGVANEIWRLAAQCPWVLEAMSAIFSVAIAWGLAPEAWRTAVVVPVFKKGDPAVATNYRPISLLETARKWFEVVVNHACASDASLMPALYGSQCGFRAHRGTADAIVALQETIRAFFHRPPATTALTRRRGPTQVFRKTYPVIVFLDIRAAYDSVVRGLLWRRLVQRGAHPELVRAMRALFDGCSSRVAVGSFLSGTVEHATGLMQGSSLSPSLYAHFLDDMLRRLAALSTWKLGEMDVAALAYADDLALIADDAAHAQRMLDVCAAFADEAGFSFAPEKCEVLATDRTLRLTMPDKAGPRPADGHWPVKELRVVERFAYLGAQFAVSGLDPVAHVAGRVKRARASALNLMRMGCHGGGYGPRMAAHLYKQVVLPALTYGCHLAPLPCRVLNTLEKAQHEFLCVLRSLPRSTSRAALQTFLGVLPVAETLRLRTASTALRVARLAQVLPAGEHVAVEARRAWLVQGSVRTTTRWGTRYAVLPVEEVPCPDAPPSTAPTEAPSPQAPALRTLADVAQVLDVEALLLGELLEEFTLALAASPPPAPPPEADAPPSPSPVRSPVHAQRPRGPPAVRYRRGDSSFFALAHQDSFVVAYSDMPMADADGPVRSTAWCELGARRSRHSFGSTTQGSRRSP